MGHGGSTQDPSVAVALCIRQDCINKVTPACPHSLLGACGVHEVLPYLRQLMVLGSGKEFCLGM